MYVHVNMQSNIEVLELGSSHICQSIAFNRRRKPRMNKVHMSGCSIHLLITSASEALTLSPPHETFVTCHMRTM